MDKFVEDLERYLEEFDSDILEQGLSVKYILDVVKNEDIQKSWKPKMGDLMVGSTGNLWVLSNSQKLCQELGGELFFFGGNTCVRGAGILMDQTMCYTVNKEGKSWRGEENDPYHSSFDRFRWVPRVGEYKEKLPTPEEYFASVSENVEEHLPVPKKTNIKES